MKFNEISNLIDEEIRNLNGKKGIIVMDIDDTLVRANPNVIKIYKSYNGGPEEALTTAQFATDPDKGKPGYKFDIREFRDPAKVYDSIVKGTPKLKNLKMMDAHLRAGYDLSFLTARGLEKIVAKALSNFLLYKNKEGKLTRIPNNVFRIDKSAAVNDETKGYPGKDDAEKKANVLRNLCNQYDTVVFVDDDPKNIAATKQLANELKNLKVVKAW